MTGDCGADTLTDALLPKVKANLILTHEEDDELLRQIIRAALDCAKTYQKQKRAWQRLPPSTEQAIIMLASSWYESRDGSTGGFFSNNTNDAQQTMETAKTLLQLNKEWQV